MSTMALSVLLATCDVESPLDEVDVALDADDPPDRPTAAPAPTPAATTAVAVSPSSVRLRCRRGGSGGGYCPYWPYCPYGYCANGSLIGPCTPILFAALF